MIWKLLHGEALGVRTGAGIVDQIPAHDGGGDGKKMTAIVPLDIFCPGKAQKSLIDEGGWLKGMVVALVAEIAVSHSAKVGHQQLEEMGFGIPVSCTPLVQQLRDFIWLACHQALGNFGVSWVKIIALNLEEMNRKLTSTLQNQ